MKKRIKLFTTIAALCFCLAVLTAGVFSALTLTYKTTGKITYEVEETVFVDIETRVYSSSKKFYSSSLLAQTAQSMETSNYTNLDQLTSTGITEDDVTYTFNKVQLYNTNQGSSYVPQNSDYQYVYSSVTNEEPPADLELNISYNINDDDTQAIQTYFVVTKLKNQSTIPVYVYVPTIGENKYIEPANSYTYKLESYKTLSNKDDEIYVVFAMSLEDITEPIDELFVLPIVATVNVEEADALFVEAQEVVKKATTAISTQEELRQQVNQIITKTQSTNLPQPVGVSPQTTAMIEVSSKSYAYDSSSGQLVKGSLKIASNTVQNQEAYFVVLDMYNGSSATVYTKLSSSTTTTASGLRIYISDSYLRILPGRTQKLVLAYNVVDKSQLSAEVQLDYNVEMALTPYTYADIEQSETGAFLSDYTIGPENDWECKYSGKIKTMTFTNSQAGIDATKIVDLFKVGTTTAEDGTKSDLNAYFSANGELFDVIVYAPVNVIYAPADCNGFFSQWFWFSKTSIEADSYSVYWSNENLEYLYLDNFDTAKTISFYAMFSGATNLKRIYGLETFNTSSGAFFLGTFVGCSSLEVLDLSSFTFEGTSSIPAELVSMGMLGLSDTYLSLMFGASVDPIINASTMEEKIYLTAQFIQNMGLAEGGTARAIAEQIQKTHIKKIICPKDISCLTVPIGLPEGEWKNQDNPDQTTYLLIDGNITLIPA